VEVLVDTNIWSVALRRSRAHIGEAENTLTVVLRDLIRDDRARLIGPIRQELLSGIRETIQYERLRGYLRAFPDENLTMDDYEHAARCNNQCRSRGIAGSGVDFLICAAALARGWQIFTTDTGFRSYAKVLPIKFHHA